MFAYVIGQTALADAYKLSNETPNIIYDLLIGGVLSATLVPVITSLSTSGSEQDHRKINAVITTSMITVTALTLVAVLAAPLIFRLYSLTVSDLVDPEVFRSAGTALTRIFLIQILFYGLTGIMNAILHSRDRFLAAAWSPVAANLVVIVALLSLPGAGRTTWTIDQVPDDQRLWWTLGFGATGGIAAMAVIVTIAVVRSGYHLRPVWAPSDPAVRRVMAMGGWTIGFVVANQVALVVVRNLAEPGSALASAYFDAFIFFVLPHGLLAVSIATTLQPRLARDVALGDSGAFSERMSSGVRAIVAVTAPASALLVVLAEPIVRVLMERGRFDAADTTNTADALRGLSVGLVGFSVFLFALRGFYANHDTRTPFFLNVGENGLNIILALLLVGPFGVAGLGLSLGVAYLVAAAVAVIVLKRRWSSTLPVHEITSETARLVGAAGVMGLAMWLVTNWLNLPSARGREAVASITAVALAGVLVYWGVAVAVGSQTVPTLGNATNALRRARARDRRGG